MWRSSLPIESESVRKVLHLVNLVARPRAVQESWNYYMEHFLCADRIPYGSFFCVAYYLSLKLHI